MSNIAQRIIEGYESDNFKSDYFAVLSETFHNERGVIINRIIDKFNVSNYETEQALSNWFVIDRTQAKKIYDFINENLSDFTKDFSGYYVGYTSLESVSFGEQEEQLSGLRNHKTGNDYTLPYLRKVFSDAGYYVNESDYAYYNLQKGLYVDLLGNTELLNDFLLTIKPLDKEGEAETEFFKSHPELNP